MQWLSGMGYHMHGGKLYQSPNRLLLPNNAPRVKHEAPKIAALIEPNLVDGGKGADLFFIISVLR